MRLPRETYQIQQTIETHLPHLSQPQLTGLVLWACGAILAESKLEEGLLRSSVCPGAPQSPPRNGGAFGHPKALTQAYLLAPFDNQEAPGSLNHEAESSLVELAVHHGHEATRMLTPLNLAGNFHDRSIWGVKCLNLPGSAVYQQVRVTGCRERLAAEPALEFCRTHLRLREVCIPQRESDPRDIRRRAAIYGAQGLPVAHVAPPFRSLKRHLQPH